MADQATEGVTTINRNRVRRSSSVCGLGIYVDCNCGGQRKPRSDKHQTGSVLATGSPRPSLQSTVDPVDGSESTQALGVSRSIEATSSLCNAMKTTVMTHGPFMSYPLG